MKKSKILEQIFNYYGSQTVLAKSLGIRRQAISQWTKIPVHHCLKIQEQTHTKFTTHQMRPDIFEKK